MKRQSTSYLTCAAVIAALYAVLTMISGAMGLAYGGIQLRISEALTVLPIFFPSAVPGLTLGCLVSNLLSTVSPLDAVFGTLATFIAAVLTSVSRKIRVKNFPLLSMFSPVIVNAVIVAAELTFLTGTQATLKIYAVYFAEVFAGQALSVFVLGGLILKPINKFVASNKAISRLCYKK